MPKMKTNRRAAKSFRRTSSGYKHKRTGRNHLLLNKARKRKRQLRGFNEVSPADRKQVAKLLPTKSR